MQEIEFTPYTLYWPLVPACTQHLYKVATTSMQRHVASTSMQRNDVDATFFFSTLHVHWVVCGGIPYLSM